MTKRIENSKILIIDDDKFILEVLSDIMKSHGFENVTLCSSFDETLDVINKQRFDLIMTDINLGSKSGLELIKLVREGKTIQAQDIPVIVFTSYSDIEIVSNALSFDISDFILKPAEPETLKERVVKALKMKKAVKPKESFKHISPTNVKNNNLRKERADSDILVFEIDELQNGMRLTEDIVSKDGKILLRKEVILTEAYIDLLIDLKSRLNDKEVYVERFIL